VQILDSGELGRLAHGEAPPPVHRAGRTVR